MTEAADEDDTLVTAGNRVGRRLPSLVVRVDGREWDEREILELAPAMTCDRVHWDTVDDFDPRLLVGDLGMAAWTRRWSDGQHRVWVEEGHGFEARERIRAWCDGHEVEAVNIRVEQGVPFRDLSRVPAALLGELVAAAVEWLYPRTHAIRARVVADLDIVEPEDVRSMMYLFVSDHLDRFDAGREGRNGTLNLLTFLLGKLRMWPQDVARATYGRSVVGDRLALLRLREQAAVSENRAPTEAERAEALGTTVTDLRRREHAIATLSSLRSYQPLMVTTADGDELEANLATDTDVAEGSIGHARAAAVTRAIMAAVDDPESSARRAQDPLALAAVYLSFWEGLSRPDVARELDVLPKTASAAVARVLERLDQTDLR